MAGKINQYNTPQRDSQKEFQELLERWKFSPLKFAEEAIVWKEGEKPTNQQREAWIILGELYQAKVKNYFKYELTEKEKEYVLKRGISIKAGQGTGKDGWLAITLLWFSLIFKDYKGMCTASSGHQLEDVLWAEIRKWKDRCKIAQNNILDLIIQKHKMFKNGKDNWFISARTVNKNMPPDQQAETLQGRHEDYMLFAIDEASGVPDPVFDALTGSLTGIFNIAIMISNPTKTVGYFYDSHNKAKSSWITLTWDSEESEIVPKSHIQIIENEVGRSSNYFRIRVKGEFATDEPGALIPYQWIEDAVDREIEVPRTDPIIFGVDIASCEGEDKSVIVIRQGAKIIDILVYPKIDTMALVGWICIEDSECLADSINLDRTGVGEGVYTRLKEIYTKKSRANIIKGVMVANSSIWKEKYYRVRDELWWVAKQQFEEGKISIPSTNKHTDALKKQLSIMKLHDPDSSGVIKVFSKKELGKKELHIADAFCLTYYNYKDNEKNERHRMYDLWRDDEYGLALEKAYQGDYAWLGV